MAGNSWALMVVAIVLIVSVTSLFRARMGIRKDYMGNELPLHDSAETKRMREEMQVLKERVAVLERIATERNHSLEQEIDRLRDR
jgi:cbb3-type cytochrome oxidase subunit 3